MNLFENLTAFLQALAGQVPDLLQPFVIAMAGAIPFVEGEVASIIGVWAGLNPVVAGPSAAAGNFLCVVVIVVFGSRIREFFQARKPSRVAPSPDAPSEESAGRKRFRRYLTRFGVPGASLLGPLAIPTQFTSAILVSTGVSKRWILLWQGIAILLWTSVVTAIAAGALALMG